MIVILLLPHSFHSLAISSARHHQYLYIPVDQCYTQQYDEDPNDIPHPTTIYRTSDI